MTTAWEMLQVSLPDRDMSLKASTPSTKLDPNNFPASPLKVETFSHEAFLKVCEELEMVQPLKTREASQSLELLFSFLTEQSLASRLEQPVHSVVEATLGTIVAACNKTGIFVNTKVTGIL